jgi:type I restriction enzyme M protein
VFRLRWDAIEARRYVEEHSGGSEVALFGQENNGNVWSISKMNLLLHGITDADLRNGDTLAEPLHVETGCLKRFDRIISNPPFSQNYVRDKEDIEFTIPFPDRFRFGWCPEKGRADLMFVQHMVAVMSEKAMVATVMPHGVLFRGGVERDIRRQLIEEDLLEAVIGLPPNLFYGTPIPACILVLRAPKAKPRNRRETVLFINADAEFASGRTQSLLLADHIEKIVGTFEDFDDVPHYAAVVHRGALRENDWNLNIRQYADNSPQPQPQDVRAHLTGGIPASEIKANARQIRSHGLDTRDLLLRSGPGYLVFCPNIKRKRDIRDLIEANAGILGREREVQDTLDDWWRGHRRVLTALPQAKNVMLVRTKLIKSFVVAFGAINLLDRFQVAGVIANWWDSNQAELHTIGARGFTGVIDSWLTTILGSLKDPTQRSSPFDHRLVRQLLSQRTLELAELDATSADIQGEVSRAQNASEDDDTLDVVLSDEELRSKKAELAALKKRTRALRKSFLAELQSARRGLDEQGCRHIVLSALRTDLQSSLAAVTTQHRQYVIGIFENLWDKYQLSLRDAEIVERTAVRELKKLVSEMGYV